MLAMTPLMAVSPTTGSQGSVKVTYSALTRQLHSWVARGLSV